MLSKNYISFIEGFDDLVELNIIKLISISLKELNSEVVYSDIEKRFYLYESGFWQPAEKEKIISIFWVSYFNSIFPVLVQRKNKIQIEISHAKKNKDERKVSELIFTMKRYDFFVKLTQKKVKEYIDSLSMASERMPETNYNKIPLKNGYIDIEQNFKFCKSTPYIYNRYRLDFNYIDNLEKKPIFFLNFLEQILPSLDDREFLLNWLAYMLVIGNYRQKSLFLYGSGRNGKGVLSKIIYNLLGVQNCSTLTVKQLSSDKYYIGQLNNKLLNISPDSDDKDRIDIGYFKTITGNDNITVRDIYGSPFNMIYQGKLLFSINKVPYFSSKDLAIMERVEILNFPITIQEKDRIPNLENIILEKEGDLIFNFLLQRVKELNKINFKFKAPSSVKAFTNEVMDEQDNISTFLIEYINENEDEITWSERLTVLYTKYKEYALDGSFKLLNRTNFKDSVQKWSARRSDIKIKYLYNGKNYLFSFEKQTTKNKLSDIPIVYETISKEEE